MQQTHSCLASPYGFGQTHMANYDREVIQVGSEFDPGVAAPKHSHPGVEGAYVIFGNFQYELDGQAPVTLYVGDSLCIPEGTAKILLIEYDQPMRMICFGGKGTCLLRGDCECLLSSL